MNDSFQILMQPFLQRGSAEPHNPIQTAGAEPCGFLHSCMKTVLSFTLHDSLPSIPRGQFPPLAEFSTQQGLSSALQPFLVLAPDGGQGMWEDGGWQAVVWAESWKSRGWKTSTAMSVHRWAVSKPVLIMLSDLEVLSLPWARELNKLHDKLGSLC